MFNFMRLPPLRRLMLMKAITGGGSWSTIVGNPVTFTAKAAPLKQLQIAFSPVQDLHGYDSPWPAGGGVNKFDCDNSGIVLSNLSLTGRMFTNTATDTRDYFAFGALAYNGSTLIPDSVTTINVRKTGRAQLQITINSECTKIRIRHSGASTNLNIDYPWTRQGTFTISIDVLGYDASTVGGLSFKDVVIADGDVTVTTYSPYSNLCPISGWSSLTVEQRGKNLLNPTAFSGTNIYTVNADGSITVEMSDGRAWANVPVIPLKAGTYYATVFGATANSQFRTSDDDYSTGYSILGTNKREIVLASDGGIKLKANISATYPVTVKILLTTDSSLTDFTPYNPSSRSISISLGETVYSGTLDVLTGVLTVDSVAKMASALTWTNNVVYANTFNGTGFTERKQRIDGSIVNGCFCDSYAWYKSSHVGAKANGIALANNATGSIDNLTRIYIKDSRFANAAEFVASLTDNDIMIVCPLQTPLTIQLTPQEVESLAGDNNLWSDANQPLTVTYRSN